MARSLIFRKTKFVATDQDKLCQGRVKPVSTQADLTGYAQDSDIGSTVQAFDADTAKTDVLTPAAAQRGTITTLTDGATVTPDLLHLITTL